MTSPRRHRVCIAADFETEGRLAHGLIRNVSDGGLFVGTTAIPHEGGRVRLHFREPGGTEIHLCGRVSWTTRRVAGTTFSRPQGFGVRLPDGTDGLRQLLGGR